ncbi:transcription-repair coupling factor [Portibacter marinus]|uniref:transcription-repair coupling factor n=1 Tax=Portibacter marinus TaxID=2898660 RepID=UPI001F2D778F|nr:transcription-repair coupling factor [Portibacter marinus]
MNTLLGRYREDERTKHISELVDSDTPKRILINGFIGAVDSFVLAGTYEIAKGNHIYIANTKEEAAYLQNDLSNLFENKTIHFFPDSFSRPLRFEELNKSNVLQRTEAINKILLSKAEGHFIITYPEAVFEKVVSPQLLAEQKIEIKVGEKLDPDTIIEILVEYGFTHEEFVYEPGQFSVRGGIVDIFSYGNEWPYRIELFDDDIESIRNFNPTTQLSIRNIKEISIIPNVNSEFTKDDKVSLFEVFDQNTSVWIQDMEVFLDKIQTSFEKCIDFANSLKGIDDTNELEQLFKERAFILPDQTLDEIEKFHTILLKKPHIDLALDAEINYNISPQPAFNKNFKILIENLEGNERKGLTNFVFAENKKQIERFYSIFDDLDAKMAWFPINISLHEGFIDNDLKIAVYTDHQIFDRFHKYKLRKGFTKEQAMNLKMLRELKPGDYVTHIDHGVGKYSGLEKIDINGHVQESVRLKYLNNDILYVSINSLHKISKFVGKDGTPPRLSKIGGDAWKKMKAKTKKKVKDIARELIKLYAQRKAAKGYAFPPDGYLQNELEASFIYEDTPDQEKATADVKEDMMMENPMDRLICGDVGFGKTEIALRAAFKAVVGGKQVAVLVPTTILALQHYKTFDDRLKEFGVSVDYVNRFRSTKEKNEIFEKLKSGELDLVIGTHGLLNKKVGFKDLGLLIIDEEQKFGVAAKEKLRNMKVNVDTLTLTATPIPRTLQFSLMSARDLSIIKTPPPNRQPIHTERRIFNDETIKDSIYYEYNRGGQVFFVHNRVKSLPDITAMVRRLVPEADVAMAHGQMESKQLEKTLLDFIDRKYDVLVCTNIIETGLDIENANTIIINNAHQFGLSDLHQLRGRVGRSNKKAFCYLFAPPLSVLTPEARKRLKTLEEFSDLGSGFEIAMKDLDIRGAGNLLGGEQSGFISDIGYETYQKILEEAVLELKETEYKDVFKETLDKERTYVRDVEIETDIEMLIPDEYINNIQERLRIYTQLDLLENEEQLKKFQDKIADRFGPIPKELLELMDGLRVRWLCKKLGFERLSLKGNKLRAYFLSNAQSSYFESRQFKHIMDYVSKNSERRKITMKQSPRFLILIKQKVGNLQQAREFLELLLQETA